MGGGPPEPPRRRRLQTTASCAGTTAGVVSVAEKALVRGRQVRIGKAKETKPLMNASRALITMPKPRMLLYSGGAWGKPACCPGGIRRRDGASPIQASTRNVGSCASGDVKGQDDA